MKRLFFTILCFFALCGYAQGQMLQAVVGGASAAAPTCGVTASIDLSGAHTTQREVGATVTSYYGGLSTFSEVDTHVDCKVSLDINKVSSYISTATYTVRLWTMSGTSLNTNVCVSAGKTGDNSWNGGAVDFDMTNCTGANCSAAGCTRTGGTSYSYTIDSGSSNNTATIGIYQSAAHTIGNAATWIESTKVIYWNDAVNRNIRIYY